MEEGRPVEGSEVREREAGQPRAVENAPEGGLSRGRGPISPAQRIVLLDIWERSGSTAEEFGELVGLTSTTLYQWRKRFLKDGPAGLMERPRSKTERPAVRLELGRQRGMGRRPGARDPSTYRNFGRRWKSV